MSEKSLAVPSFAGLTMPKGVGQERAPIVSSLQFAPYITFAHPSRKDEWAKLQMRFGAQNVKDGDPFYIDGDDMRSMKQMKVGFVCGQQHWVHKAANGDLIAYSRNPKPDPWREHVEAILLAYLDDKVVPCNVTFRTTKCGAAVQMDEALRLASTPDWGHQGPAYAATMQVQAPFLRFYADMTLNAPRTSKKTGLPYSTFTTVIVPTGPAEWDKLKAFGTDGNAQTLLNMASERYEQVLSDLAVKEVE